MNFDDMSPALVCIYSLPRSGSTVLIAELDRLKGVICLPESYFPQVLELLSPDEQSNPGTLAAFFLASSPSGSVLSFEEAKGCMVPGNWNKTLVNLGLACALKTKRKASEVTVVIWKTTRIIGRWQLFSEAGGRFILLHRNQFNVFESQFRVDFGQHNRNPFRFATFLESYEAAFARLPKNNTHYVEYELIPKQFSAIQTWLDVSNEHWADGESSLAKTHAKKTWHSGLLDGFQSSDPIKRNNVTTLQRISINAGRLAARPFRPILGLLRDYYDKGIMNQIRVEAEEIIANNSH